MRFNLFAQEQSDEASVVEEEIVEETPEEHVAKAEKSPNPSNMVCRSQLPIIHS